MRILSYQNVLVTLVPVTVGATRALGVAEGPFPVMRTVLLPRLDSDSSFFNLIFAYMSLLNLVVIPTRGKHL